MAYTLGDLAKQGSAHTVRREHHDHKTRGSMSPVGGGRPVPMIIHRDEDVASAPMERTPGRRGAIPKVNKSAGIPPRGRNVLDRDYD